jgi:formamidopyrimidine-DNA glycosylase
MPRHEKRVCKHCKGTIFNLSSLTRDHWCKNCNRRYERGDSKCFQ